MILLLNKNTRTSSQGNQAIIIIIIYVRKHFPYL